MTLIETKIILGLIAWSVLSLLLAISTSFIHLNIKKEKFEKNIGSGIIGIIWLVWYLGLIWYWIDLYSESLE